MQYLLLIYEAEEIWENMPDAEKTELLAGHLALHNRMTEDGVVFNGEPLMPTSTAVSVRVRGGSRQATDGPFAETKEQLAGFYLVDVPGLEQAVEYAAGLPEAQFGTIEVRPIANHGPLMPGPDSDSRSDSTSDRRG